MKYLSPKKLLDIEKSDKRALTYLLDFRKSDENIFGVGYGFKKTQGVITDTPAMVFFVKKKIDTEECTFEIPESVGKFATDVEEVGVIKPSWNSPVYGGESVGAVNASSKESGTLGCRCFRLVGDQKKWFMLSNAHVFQQGNGFKGDSICQPGHVERLDWRNNIIGELHSWVPITSGSNFVDAAIAEILNNNLNGDGDEIVTDQIIDLGRIVEYRGWEDVYPGLEVFKRGAGLKKVQDGSVMYVLCSFFVEIYGKSQLFDAQLVASNFTVPGDSGTLLVTKDGIDLGVVGLVFAHTKNYAIANYIDVVQYLLGISVAEQKFTG